MHVAACVRLVSPLDFQQEQQQQAKRVPDGHGRSFGSWPWQKKFSQYYKINVDCFPGL